MIPLLVPYMFPLSRRREDTFIAGLSMGGFGALRNGMKYAETFSRIAAFSSGVHFFDPELFHSLAGEESVFGDLAEAAKTEKSHYVVFEQLKRRVAAGEVEAPKFWMSCGTEDSLLSANLKFRDMVLKAGFDLDWDEEPRGHDWDFWDSQIKKVIDWLALGATDATLGSGYVAKDF